MLAFVVLKRMTGATWRSLIAAMLFGLHPLRVESVAWVAERKDVLSAFFFMLTLWAYVRYAEESKLLSPTGKVAEEDRREHFPRLGPLKPRAEGDSSPRPY